MGKRKHTSIQLKLPLDGVLEIPLTQGQVTIVDAIDADLALVLWHASFQPEYANGGKFTAARGYAQKDGKRTVQIMHRVILARMLGRSLSRSEHVDHINGDPLDNRRGNLRLATNGQNRMNSGKSRNNKSNFKGVSWDKHRRKWIAQIQANDIHERLGYFDTPEEAYEVFCKAAKERHGEFANFG